MSSVVLSPPWLRDNRKSLINNDGERCESQEPEVKQRGQSTKS